MTPPTHTYTSAICVSYYGYLLKCITKAITCYIHMKSLVRTGIKYRESILLALLETSYLHSLMPLLHKMFNNFYV